MLQFTDLIHVKHCIHLPNVNNVVFREKDGQPIITFHMNSQHFLVVTVDKRTAERIFKELETV